MKLLALIPARGGSVRIPRKNIKELCGKPLVVWSIDSALESKLIDKVLVSTDDSSIGSIVANNGADVLYRPSDLSDADASLQPVIFHAVSKYPMFDAVVVLNPTSPIRIHGLVDKCIRRFVADGCDELVTGFYSVERAYPHPDIASHLLLPHFVFNGSVRILTKELVLSGKPFGDNITMFETGNIYNHEVDTMDDYDDMVDRIRRLGL